MVRAVPADRRLTEYWQWVGATLYVLLTLDLLTTRYAASIYGAHAEANPFMRWVLRQGLATLLAVHLGALCVLAVLFHAVIELTRRAPDPCDDVVALAFEVWLALVLGAGLFVFANNLTVIVHGTSLLAGVASG